MAEHKTHEGLDWAQAYARLEQLARATQAPTSTHEEMLALLDARARELAQPLVSQQAPGALLEVTRWRSGDQAYALATRFIHEVLRGAELIPLPGAPALLCGLTLLRGEVLPVVELAPLFGRPASSPGTVVLVVGASRPELGLAVAQVEEVVPLPRDTFLPPPAPLQAQGGALVSGINREGLILLEGEALLSDSRLIFDISDEGTS